MAASKRPSLADDDLRAAKIPKVEPALAASPLAAHRPLPDNDFSRSVKKKLASSSRTGQACDRCKVRALLSRVYAPQALSNADRDCTDTQDSM